MTVLWLVLGLGLAQASETPAQTYAMFCATCHGGAGAGDGIAGKALKPPPANFTDPAFWESRDDAHLKKAILEGGPAVGKSPIMVGWEGRLDPEKVDALVQWMREEWGPAEAAPSEKSEEADEEEPPSDESAPAKDE